MKSKKYQYMGFALVVIIMYTIVTNFSSFTASINGVYQVVKPIVYGIGIAYFVYPIVMLLYKKFMYKADNNKIKKLGYYLSILVSYLVIFLLVYLLYLWLAPILVDSFYKIASLDYKKIASDTVLNWQHLQDRFAILEGIDGAKIIENAIGRFSSLVSVENISRYINSLLGFTSSIYAIVMGIIVSIYMIISKDELFKATNMFFEAILSSKQFFYTKKYFLHFEKTFKKFFFGKMLDSLIIGILALIGLYLLHIPMFPLLAVVVMVTNMIPYFGPFIGGIPVVLVTLFVTGDPIHALWSALFILALQQFDGIYLGPKILGDSVGVSSVWVIIAIIIGGATFGVIGLLLCVPMAATIKDMFNEFYAYRMNERKNNKEQIISNED